MRSSITIRKFLSLLVLAIASALAIGTARADISDFPAKVGHPLKWVFIASTDKEETQAFIDAVKAADKKGILDADGPVTDIGEADMILFLLNDWEDAGMLPFQDSFGEVYKEMPEIKSRYPDILTHSVELRVNGGKPYLLIFYNRAVAPEAAVECYARSFIAVLESPEAGRRNSVANCRLEK